MNFSKRKVFMALTWASHIRPSSGVYSNDSSEIVGNSPPPSSSTTSTTSVISKSSPDFCPDKCLLEVRGQGAMWWSEILTTYVATAVYTVDSDSHSTITANIISPNVTSTILDESSFRDTYRIDADIYYSTLNTMGTSSAVLLTQTNTYDQAHLWAPTYSVTTIDGTALTTCAGDATDYLDYTYRFSYSSPLDYWSLKGVYRGTTDFPWMTGASEAEAYFTSVLSLDRYSTLTCQFIIGGEARAKIAVTALTSTSLVFKTTSTTSIVPTPASAIAGSMPTPPGASVTPPPTVAAPTQEQEGSNGKPMSTSPAHPVLPSLPQPTTQVLTLGRDTFTLTVATSLSLVLVNGQTLPSLGAVATLPGGLTASWGITGVVLEAGETLTTLNNNNIIPSTAQGIPIGSQTLTSGGVVVESGTTYSLVGSSSIIGIGGGKTLTTKIPPPSSTGNPLPKPINNGVPSEGSVAKQDTLLTYLIILISIFGLG